MTIDVIIYSVDAGVTQSGTTLTATSTGATSFNWINCATNVSVAGANGQSFTPTVNGSYAVVVLENGCYDTSACYTINTISVDELLKEAIVVYPNPSTGMFAIDYDGEITGLKMIDVTGRSVSFKSNSGFESIDASDLDRGKYMLMISTKEGEIVKELIIQ